MNTITTLTTTTLTLPAYAADTLGETITLTVPTDRVRQVEALAKFLPYGHEFNRADLDELITCSRISRHGCVDGAAERIDALANRYCRTDGQTMLARTTPSSTNRMETVA